MALPKLTTKDIIVILFLVLNTILILTNHQQLDARMTTLVSQQATKQCPPQEAKLWLIGNTGE